MEPVEWLYQTEIAAAILLSLALAIARRPGGMRLLASIFAGAMVFLFAWTVEVYFHRWGVWEHASGVKDLLNVPLEMLIAVSLAAPALCFLVIKRSKNKEEEESASSKAQVVRIGAIVIVTSALGALFDTLNCVRGWTMQCESGAGIYPAALAFWIAAEAIALFSFWMAMGALAPGTPAFVKE